ncbi:MAG TPA: hypothetical protein VN956_17140 [Pyrinomonadaceae bacterium]|nr:hypothetical protein [Pyrinomonadaceae bacterium]
MRYLVKQFLDQSPTALLGFGIAVSLIDSIALYGAAAKDDVLHITQGVGLLNNYGLFSTIAGNAISFYLARKYYDCVCSIRTSKAISKSAPVESSLSKLTTIIQLHGRYRFLLYGLATLGALCWLSNLGTHVFGNPEVRWGHKVFDSPDHPLSFFASRLHNFYTWLIIMPFVGHVIFFSSLQLKRAMAIATSQGAVNYDLLNPDQRGGFGFVDKANIVFNVIVVLVYIQITLHIETFAKMNTEHVIGYVILTLFLIGINRMFLGGIYGTIKTLRLKSLDRMKEKAYNDDKQSFEILKYCYERRTSTTSIVSFLINPGAIVVSGIIKLWPIIAKAFTRA